jgi:putative transposase
MIALKIKLKKRERSFLEDFVRKGTRKSRAIARANILLLADEGYSTEQISMVTKVHRQSIWRIKKRYLEEGLDPALVDKPRSGQPKKYNEKQEAEVIATACTSPPKGRKRWSVRLLAEELKKKKGLETINRESVRLILKKTKQSPG